jgi:hypothetical protein
VLATVTQPFSGDELPPAANYRKRPRLLWHLSADP